MQTILIEHQRLNLTISDKQYKPISWEYIEVPKKCLCLKKDIKELKEN